MQTTFYRDSDNKIISGLCSGLAKTLNMDVVAIRLLFIFFTLFHFELFFLYLLLSFCLNSKSYKPEDFV